MKVLQVPKSSTEQRKLAKEMFKNYGMEILGLVKELENGDWKERSLACFLLGEIGTQTPSRAFNSLKEAASDDDWRVREAVATALTEISHKRERDFLEEMSEWVEDDNSKVKRAAVESLRFIARRKPQKILYIIEKVKTEPDKYVRDAVSHILREITKVDPELVEETCKKWLREGNRYTFLIVKHGIKKLDPGKQESILQQSPKRQASNQTLNVSKIKTLAADKEAGERRKALKEIRELNRIGVDVFPLLEDLVKDERGLVRRTAVLAAGLVYKGEDRKILYFSRKALKDDDWQVREAGANILRNVQEINEETLKLILKYSRDEKAIVNRSIGDSLAHLYFKNKEVLVTIDSLAGSNLQSQRKTAAFSLRNIINKEDSFLQKLKAWVKGKDDNKKWTAAYTCKLLKKRRDEAETILKEIKGTAETMKMVEKSLKELKKHKK